jgi:inward rectifier potassium channel
MLNFVKLPKKINSKPQERELGFGKAAVSEGRMMNIDGTFNVERERFGVWDNTYFALVTMPGWQFMLLVLSSFILFNTIFGITYCLIGMEHLDGTVPGTFMDNFRQAYFFSSQTLTTVGYGHVSPVGFLTNVVASLESFMGLLTFALISGLLYGRFSRPVARIVFSERMLAAPYKGGLAMMFRMVNARRSELIETEVQVILMINQADESGESYRRYFALPLEISKVSFFSLSWTIVHPLNEDSPIFGFSAQDLLDGNAEFLVLVKGTDEANQQTVHTKRSYTAEEVIWNARFKPVIARGKTGRPRVITNMIGDYELLAEVQS